MKIVCGLMSLLLFCSCSTLDDEPKLSDSEKIYEILSTSSEFEDMSLLLCLEKDCLTVDRREDSLRSKRRVIHEDSGKD